MESTPPLDPDPIIELYEKLMALQRFAEELPRAGKAARHKSST